ncbi:hypothetical protein HJFPF1_10377 [Paramyrothecium foliicola]|nr:hypothetical protein HJFPF1_10377 [Paramyrothecium foliicola]
MRYYTLTLSIGLSCLLSSALANVDCGSTVVIFNSDDAREVAENCSVIDGDLVLAENITESVHIEDLKEIKGSLTLEGRRWDAAQPEERSFNITMPDLAQIGGALDIDPYPRLERLVLSKLETVRGRVGLNNPTVEFVDITNLKFIQSFSLSTPGLETLLLSGLEGPYEGSDSNFHIYLSNVGQVDSLDGIFKNPIDPYFFLGEPGLEGPNLVIASDSFPNVKAITFGWKRIARIESYRDDLTITFGGPKSKSVEIEELRLENGTQMRRAETVERLKVGYLSITENNVAEISLDVDEASSVRVQRCDRLRSLTISAAAKKWEDTQIDVSDNPLLSLSLTSEEYGARIWHWPENAVNRVLLSGNMTHELIEDFWKTTTATEDFIVNDYSGNVDCDAVDEQPGKSSLNTWWVRFAGTVGIGRTDLYFILSPGVKRKIV